MGKDAGEVQGGKGSTWVRAPTKHHVLTMNEVAERLGSWQHFSQLYAIKGGRGKEQVRVNQ